MFLTLTRYFMRIVLGEKYPTTLWKAGALVESKNISAADSEFKQAVSYLKKVIPYLLHIDCRQ